MKPLRLLPLLALLTLMSSLLLGNLVLAKGRSKGNEHNKHNQNQGKEKTEKVEKQQKDQDEDEEEPEEQEEQDEENENQETQSTLQPLNGTHQVEASDLTQGKTVNSPPLSPERQDQIQNQQGETLPPGIAKRLQQGKPLPPGIAKQLQKGASFPPAVNGDGDQADP